jgi:hypothetical protein
LTISAELIPPYRRCGNEVLLPSTATKQNDPLDQYINERDRNSVAIEDALAASPRKRSLVWNIQVT